MDTTHPGRDISDASQTGSVSVLWWMGSLAMRVAVFTALVGVAYVAGRHLIPATAVDAALLWVFGLLHLPAEAVVLAPL